MKGLMGCGAEESRRLSRVQPGYWVNGGGGCSGGGAWEKEQVEGSWRILGLELGTELGSSGTNYALAFLTALQPPYPLPAPSTHTLPRTMLSVLQGLPCFS